MVTKEWAMARSFLMRECNVLLTLGNLSWPDGFPHPVRRGHVRFTILGLTISSSWGNGHATPLRAIIRGLHRLGHEVTFFERETTYYAQHRDLPHPDFCELRFYDEWLNIRREALTC